MAAGALVASGLTLATATLAAPPAVAETQKPNSQGLSSNTFYAYVQAGESLTVTGPTTSVTAPDGAVTTGDGVRGPAAADGVWIVEMTSPPDSYNWEVTVQDAAGADVLGRVWSSMYTMINPDSTLSDYRWWVLNDSGYQYQITTDGYNGVLSRIRASAVGYTQPGTCTPLYRSVENTTGDWNPVADCAGDYRVFFEEPDPALPDSAPSAEGTLVIAPEPLLDEDLEATDISFVPTGPGTTAGTLSYTLDPRFSGGYTVQVDANGNGSYDDPVDRTETFGTDGSASHTYAFDGLDANGAAIGACTAVTARVAFDRLGEVHVLQDDVEGRTGGIEIIRQTGPAAPDSTIYWDDRALTNPTTNTTPVLDGRAGVDSTGGVHGWGYAGLSWGGNNRGIDDWTYYSTDATSPEVLLAAASNDCLAVEKTSDFTADSRVGDTITYTVTATNTGDVDFTADNPAVVFDDLSGVLDDATYNGDAEATVGGAIAGAVAYEEPLLSWAGPLAAGQTVELTYTVELKKGGDRVAENVAWSPEDPEIETPPACDPRDANGLDPETGVPCALEEGLLPLLKVDKVADRTELPRVGDMVTYTVTATNNGPGVYTDEAPATVVDDLTEVLDDADFVADSLTTSTGDDATFADDQITWSGALGVGETVTLTYKVTYTAEGDRLLKNVAWEPTDPEDPTPPVCDPRDVNGNDPVTGEACGAVNIPGSLLEVSKNVDPEDGSIVRSGETLTYTLTFGNTEGLAAADVIDWTDDLSDVLDDAVIVTAPTASTDDLTASAIEDGQFVINGSVPAGESVTVTYTVQVLPNGERGDSILGNFLFDEVPPSECLPDDPLCTVNPVGDILPSKTVDPTTGTTVDSGDELTYTLTFKNVGGGAAPVDYTDYMEGVLDDAQLVGAPVATQGLAVAGPTGGELRITGSVAAGQTATVTYTVRVKAYAQQGDHKLANFLTPEGLVPPTECLANNPLCTQNPIDPPGQLPATGGSIATGALAAGVALLIGGGALLYVRRRREESMKAQLNS